MLATDAETTLSDLLDRVGEELVSLAENVDGLQTALSPMLTEAGHRDPAICRHAQSLDLLLQTLESLGTVLAAAARDGASRHAVDVDTLASMVPLACLAKRLKGGGGEHAFVGSDLDLF